MPGGHLLHQHPAQSLEDVTLAEGRGQEFTGFDPVLYGNHRRGRPDQRPERRREARDLRGLHAHEHHVDDTDGAGIVGALYRRQRQIAVDALEDESARAQRIEGGAARDEDDVVAGLLQTGTQHAADGTSPDDGDAQPIQLTRRRVGITHGLPIEKPAMCASVL